jgi:hypothetical protein
LEGNGIYNVINIALPAYQSHVDHGDADVGDYGSAIGWWNLNFYESLDCTGEPLGGVSVLLIDDDELYPPFPILNSEYEQIGLWAPIAECNLFALEMEVEEDTLISSIWSINEEVLNGKFYASFPPDINDPLGCIRGTRPD